MFDSTKLVGIGKNLSYSLTSTIIARLCSASSYEHEWLKMRELWFTRLVITSL